MNDQVHIHFVRISAAGHRGDGIAEVEGRAVYVPLALPNEEVRVSVDDGGRAKLLQVLQPSQERVAPFCPHFGACGGCALQHWAEAPYRTWKRDLVTTTLKQRGIEATIGELVDAHGVGRRRATLHARWADGQLAVGFAALRSHVVIDLDHCPVLTPALSRAPAIVLEVARIIGGTVSLDLTFTATDTGPDCAIGGVKDLSPALRSRLAELLRNHDLARISLAREVVVEARPPMLTIGRASVPLPPGAFLQPTAEGENVLWEHVRAGVGQARKVADLFCGVGPFALRLAETASVSAFDSDGASVAALNAAARRATRLKPVRAEDRDLYRLPLLARELFRFDAVVLDPPRQGAQAQSRELAKSKVPIVVMVSCDPGTFARDAALLIQGGYRMGRVTPVDQFKWTPHVECVAAFTRG